jgi:hypothetical protein
VAKNNSKVNPLRDGQAGARKHLPEQQARPDVLRKTTPIARLEQSLKWPESEPQDHAAYEKLAQGKAGTKNNGSYDGEHVPNCNGPKASSLSPSVKQAREPIIHPTA